MFSSYVCNSLKHIEKIKKHPGDIVEAGSLAVSIYSPTMGFIDSITWNIQHCTVNLLILSLIDQ